MAAGEGQDRLENLRTRLAEHPRVCVAFGGRELELTSRHGLFSARALDEGTAMLLGELVSLPPAQRTLDLGCGYGAIGAPLAAAWPTVQVTMVDSDIRAVEAAGQNVASLALGNARVALSDGVCQLGGEQFDLVVSNLPAQAGNDALDALLLGAHDALDDDGGLLVVVAVNGLRRYLQRRLGDIFGPQQVSKVRQGRRHSVLQAAKREP